MNLCIYCRRAEPQATFLKAEHVVPQSFGKFESNWTLFCVCDDCNKYFGDNLELFVARDTVEGLDRYVHSVVTSDQIKTLGRRSRLVTRIRETEAKGAKVFAKPAPSGGITFDFPPQVGFASTAEGDYEFFDLDALPAPADLVAKGLPERGDIHVRLVNAPPEVANAALIAKGHNPVRQVGTFTLPTGEAFFETVGKIEETEFRLAAKIALNYVARVAGSSVALMENFDALRAYARHGTKPAKAIVTVDDRPITQVRVLGHVVTAEWNPRNGHIRAQVSLMGRYRYQVEMTRLPIFVNPGVASGHYFNVVSRRIVRLLRGPRRWSVA